MQVFSACLLYTSTIVSTKPARSIIPIAPPAKETAFSFSFLPIARLKLAAPPIPHKSASAVPVSYTHLLSGQLETTNGNITITPGQRLSFLQQDHFKYDSYPVLDTVIMGNQRLYDIMKEKEAIYSKEDFTDEDGIRASELEGEFAEMNGWEAESDAAMLLLSLIHICL